MYIPEASAKKILQIILGLDLAEDITLGLFVNDATIVDGTVIGDLTEMYTHGYAAKTLTMGSWGAPSFSTPDAISVYAQQTWTFTAAATVTVYGYFAKMGTTLTLLWACKFGAGKPITYANETIKVTPEFRFGLA